MQRRLIFIVLFFCAISAIDRASAAVVASDNADDPAYTNLWIGENGGSGFQPWHEIQANGGGTFLENSGRQIDGAQSFAIFAGDQSGGTW